MSNRRILVTGASRGLGRAMTDAFVALGHTVVGCSRDETAVAELRKRYGEPHRFSVVDVADEQQVAAWAKEVLDAGGPPDLLLNNAAVINANAPLWEVTPAEFSRVIDINIKGVFHVLHHFTPAMIARGEGVIVNFSSGWGRSVSPEVATYCATKWAIEGLTQALALELPAGMAAVPLNPGVIHTGMLSSCWGEDAAAYPGPQDWARRAVPFLLQIQARDNGRSLTVPA
ncbi:SDR family oxidoreductase [Lignipirellula cremea]|uniref:3-oxoacyl-[acyl-carrier-protein] reductase FabG n=1 Tax=Lignipirellula cremea TaxID=2528010 RepID=A0A518DTS1_9BACT|nr:SDR family oxidoreductase [Lignipirellula cremea]QDU95232.1 3-oxoacyl-[acyl-carrier-protein] reductase FabG [Lignipirellula cremea]